MEKIKVNMIMNEDKNILDQMYQDYLNCPAAVKNIKQLEIPEEKVIENITKIYDFVSDINYCKNCPGLSKCQKDKPGLVTRIVYKSGVVDRYLAPCKKMNEKMIFESNFIHHDFPDEWLDLIPRKDLDRNSGVRKEVLKAFGEYLNKGINSWIALNGTQRTGRTFLAAMLCMEAVNHHKGPAIFADCTLRFRELNDLAFSDKTRFNKVLDQYCNIPILVLDDFGNEFKNEYVRDTIVLPILLARSKKKLFTIITSDFSFSEIAILYDLSKSKAGQIKSEQLERTLKGACPNVFNLGDLSIY